MKIYNYDPSTFVFTGVSKADSNPLEEGKWIMPTNATKIPPPEEITKGYAIVFDGNNWVEKIDNRGTQYWTVSGSKIIITKLGVEVPKDALETEPDVRTNDQKKRDTTLEIQNISEKIRSIAVDNAGYLKIAGWNAKVERATRIVGGVGRPNDLKIIEAEAQIKGRTAEEQSQRILDESAQFGELNGYVDGFEDKLIELVNAGEFEIARDFILQADTTLPDQTKDTISAWVTKTAGTLKTAFAK